MAIALGQFINNVIGAPKASADTNRNDGKGKRLDLAGEFIFSKKDELGEICHSQNSGLDQEVIAELEQEAQTFSKEKKPLSYFFEKLSNHIKKQWRDIFAGFDDFLKDKEISFFMMQRTPAELNQIINNGIGSGIRILNAFSSSILDAYQTSLKRLPTRAEFIKTMDSLKELAMDLSSGSIHMNELMCLDDFLVDETNKRVEWDDKAQDFDVFFKTHTHRVRIAEDLSFDIDRKAFEKFGPVQEDKKTFEAVKLHPQQSNMEKRFGCPARGVIPLLTKEFLDLSEKLLYPHLDKILKLAA